VPNFSDGYLGPREPEHIALSVTTCVALARSAGRGGARAATEEVSRADFRGRAPAAAIYHRRVFGTDHRLATTVR
jgi:hypothetical protein